VTGELLLQMLERRLDNVVFRLGLGASRSAARQIVRHGHITVNGRCVDIPSFQVRPGDEVAVREKSREMVVIKQSLESRKGQGVPDWLELHSEKLSGRVLHVPTRASIGVPINEQLIVELYSK
jgi:small subunit ribosomal protein S4